MKVRKNPLYALALSVVPGLGQVYNGDLRKGYLMMLGAVLAFVLSSGLGFIGAVLRAALWVVVALEAYQSAAKTADGTVVERDPHLALALSHLLDGVGQFYNGEPARGIFLSAFGLTPCAITLFVLLQRIPLREFFDSHGEYVFTANLMITWLIVAVGLRVFALLDAYFTARNRLDDFLPRA